MTAEAPILIAYDGSDAARLAIGKAAELFASRRIVVMTVWEPGLAAAMATPMPPLSGLAPGTVDIEAARDADEQLQERAERIARDGADLAGAAGLDAEAIAVAEAKNVSDAITGQAREAGAAAIVVGSRGLSGLRARMEGSTSSAVLKNAPCPVLVVHND